VVNSFGDAGLYICVSGRHFCHLSSTRAMSVWLGDFNFHGEPALCFQRLWRLEV
jgi:hypothetical protein